METFVKIGTIIKVKYKHDGIEENQLCILADVFEEEYLFQVISINGYHSGSIEGYVRKQFFDDKQYSCTISYLIEQLEKNVFIGFQEAKIFENNPITNLENELE